MSCTKDTDCPDIVRDGITFNRTCAFVDFKSYPAARSAEEEAFLDSLHVTGEVKSGSSGSFCAIRQNCQS